MVSLLSIIAKISILNFSGLVQNPKSPKAVSSKISLARRIYIEVFGFLALFMYFLFHQEVIKKHQRSFFHFLFLWNIFISSPPEVLLLLFIYKGVPERYSKFRSDHPCRSALYWNHTSALVFSCKFAVYSRNIFLKEHLWKSTCELSSCGF